MRNWMAAISVARSSGHSSFCLSPFSSLLINMYTNCQAIITVPIDCNITPKTTVSVIRHLLRNIKRIYSHCLMHGMDCDLPLNKDRTESSLMPQAIAKRSLLLSHYKYCHILPAWSGTTQWFYVSTPHFGVETASETTIAAPVCFHLDLAHNQCTTSHLIAEAIQEGKV